MVSWDNSQLAFQVGLSRHFCDHDGKLQFGDVGLDILDADPRLQYRFFEHDEIVKPEQIEGLNAIISVHERYPADTLKHANDLLGILYFGVGYDHFDVEACTESDTLLIIQKGSVDNSMAESIVAWMLALAHRVKEKDQLARTGRWEDAIRFNGIELRDRTIGVIGLGGVGSRLVQMLSGFGMSQPMVFDPYGDHEKIVRFGARRVDLRELMKKSDFVCVCCPLNKETRGLIGREQLEFMKPTAYLINAARGGIVDESALVDLLRARRIAGAAFDVFDGEPASCDHPYTQLDNMILAPHCIGWTEELFRDIGRMACRKVTLLAGGQVPDGVVNPEVLQRTGFKNKLRRFQHLDSGAAV